MFCGLCGHLMNLDSCGYAGVNGVPLCHHDDHDCYRRVTVYHEEFEVPETYADKLLAAIHECMQRELKTSDDANKMESDMDDLMTLTERYLNWGEL